MCDGVSLLLITLLRAVYERMMFVCHLQKLVCTTIQPTELPFGELYDWQGAADFVADYLHFVPLQPPHELVSCCFLSLFTANTNCLNNST